MIMQPRVGIISNGTENKAARNTGLIPYYELQGPKFWLYEDELLTNRRKRIQGL